MEILNDSLHDLEKWVHRYQYRMLGLDCMRLLHTSHCLRSGHTLLLRKHYFHIHNYSYLLLSTADPLRIPWKSIESCEKKEKSAASFPSKFRFPTNKRFFLFIRFNFDRFRNRLRLMRTDIDRRGRSWGGFVNVQCYAHVRHRQIKGQSGVKATTRFQAGYGISLSSKKYTKNDPRTSEEHAKMDSTTAFERFWIRVVDRSLMASLASN